MTEKQASLTVAFATTDMKQVNQHFGSSKAFAIYAIGANNAHLLEVIQFDDTRQDGNEDKLAIKMEALSACGIVYSQAVGSSAVQQLMRKNIQPVRVEPGTEIFTLIQSLQEELNNGPSPWVAKALSSNRGSDTSRFDQMEEEGWQE